MRDRNSICINTHNNVNLKYFCAVNSQQRFFYAFWDRTIANNRPTEVLSFLVKCIHMWVVCGLRERVNQCQCLPDSLVKVYVLTGTWVRSVWTVGFFRLIIVLCFMCNILILIYSFSLGAVTVYCENTQEKLHRHGLPPSKSLFCY